MQMPIKNTGIDRLQTLLRWEANTERCEMTLQPRSNSETTRCRIHACHDLTIVDLLQGQLLSIVPMSVIEELS